MDERVDRLLARLAAERSPPGLRFLERDVWARLHDAREVARLPMTWRAGLAAASLAVGAAVGGAGLMAPATAAGTDPLAVFSVGAQLAPSTLIDGRH